MQTLKHILSLCHAPLYRNLLMHATDVKPQAYMCFGGFKAHKDVSFQIFIHMGCVPVVEQVEGTCENLSILMLCLKPKSLEMIPMFFQAII